MRGAPELILLNKIRCGVGGKGKKGIDTDEVEGELERVFHSSEYQERLAKAIKELEGFDEPFKGTQHAFVSQ